MGNSSAFESEVLFGAVKPWSRPQACIRQMVPGVSSAGGDARESRTLAHASGRYWTDLPNADASQPAHTSEVAGSEGIRAQSKDGPHAD